MKTLIPLFLAMILAPAMAFGNFIINDSFADGDRAITGGSGADVEGEFYASTNSSGIEDAVGNLGMVSGTSGRGIHAVFATQSLATVGDKLTLSYTFTTPVSIEGAPPNNLGTPTGESSAFRIGLFDASLVPGGSAAYQTDITSSTSTLHENLAGFMMDHDVNTGAEDLNFRQRLAPGVGQDRLLSTTGDYSSIGSSSSPDGDYAFVGTMEYMGWIMVERTSLTELTLSGSISGNGGGTTHMETYAPTSGSFDFNLLAFHANGNNFGSSSSADTPDNGLDFSNISLDFTAIPEPSTSALLLGALVALGIFRRRK